MKKDTAAPVAKTAKTAKVDTASLLKTIAALQATVEAMAKGGKQAASTEPVKMREVKRKDKESKFEITRGTQFLASIYDLEAVKAFLAK